jgi:tripartite-type tricarboxylate transporter receptor subunit TctC
MKISKLATKTVATTAVLALAMTACGSDTASDETDASPSAEDDAGETDAADAAEEESDTDEGGENPLAGQQLNFAVPFDAGGGYDQYARVMVPYLEEELDATVVVVNEPGAGGLVSTNQTWAGPTDGTRFQILNTTSALLAELSGEESVQFDAAEFEWIARVVGEPEVLLTAKDGPLETMEDLLEHAEETGSITFTSTGVMNEHSMSALVIEEWFGVPVEIVAGFDGTNDAFAAVMRGDADAMFASVGTGVEHSNADEAHMVVATSAERPSIADDVPAITEFDGDPDAQVLIDVTDALHFASRAIIAPPGTDAAAVAALRDAFENVFTNQEFLDEMEAGGRVIEFMSGEEVESGINDAMGSPPEQYTALIEEAFARAS